MATQAAVRIACDGCGAETEWRPLRWRERPREAAREARKLLARWRRDENGRDLCPLCVRVQGRCGRHVGHSDEIDPRASERRA